LDLLILGGTGFLGRHLVEAALGDGHRPTLFNRGLTKAELFPEVERIEGDREGDLSPLLGRRWDSVIDTCGYVPRVVGASARLLADAGRHTGH
jgi:2'-hydroxyisoflavone reductase